MKTSERVLVRTAIVVLVAAFAAVGCGPPATESTPDLPPLPEVNVSAADPIVAEQISAARHEAETNTGDQSASGKLGVLYELYQYPDAARACYLRAVAIEPDDFRWQYFLGRSEHALGNPTVAIDVLSRTVELAPKYVPAIALLGEAFLVEGRLDELPRRRGSGDPPPRLARRSRTPRDAHGRAHRSR